MSCKGVSAVLGTALIKGPHMNAVNSVSTNEPICLYGCPSLCLEVCLSFFPPVYLSTKQTPSCLIPRLTAAKTIPILTEIDLVPALFKQRSLQTD